jgi:YD repeat-containing protein
VGGQVSNGPTFTAITSGTVSGTVSNSADNSAISAATVQALQKGTVKDSATTATDGTYSLPNLAAGRYDLKVSATGFGTALQNSIAVTAGQTSTANFSLTAPGTISGTVTQADGVTAISGAGVQVYVGSAAGSSATTDATGNYSIAGLNAGSYTVQANATGYVTKSQSVNLSGSTATGNFILQASGSNPIQYVYDELGRLVGAIDASGDAVIYKYDAVGNVLSISRQSSAQLSIISFSPQSGLAGAAVTINGTGFSAIAAQNTVQFNGVAASVVSSTASQIVVTVPASATTGPIAVTTSSASVSSTGNFTVPTDTGAPVISSFTPNMGASGTAVSIAGTNFDTLANDKITFNTAHAAVTSATGTQISASVPSNATSGHIAIATPAGQGASAQDFFVPFGTHVAADIGFTGRISAGGSQPITLAAGKIALLLFDAVAGQGASLQLSGSTFATCTLYLIAPGGAQLTSSSCTSGTTFVGSVTEPVSGTYTIGIDPGTSAGSITIGLTPDVASSITPGTPIAVTTSSPGQNARYTFSAVAGQQVSVNLTGSTYTGCNAVVVSIAKPDGSTLGSTGLCNTSTGFLDSLTLPSTGVYTVLIDPQGAGTGSVNVLLNLFTDAGGPITPGTAVTAATSFAGQNARYTFSGTAGQQVSVNVTNSTYSGCLSLIVRVLNPDGSTLGSTGTCGSTVFVDSLTLGSTGTYTVVVDPQGTITGSATVLLTVFNDVTGTITAGTPITASTTLIGQNAKYTFSGTAGQQVSVNVTNSTYTGCLSLIVRVLNPDGSTLGSTGTCGSTLLVDSLTLGSTGTYTVVVDPQGITTGSATLLLTTFNDVTGTITAGTPITASTSLIGQNAKYTFSGAAGQQVSVTFTNSTYAGCFGLVISIVKPDGSTLGSSGTCSATGFLDSLTLPVAGTYTVLVNPQGTATGSVTVLLNIFADVTGAITAGTPVTATTTTAGQNASYTFSGTTGQQVSVTFSNSTYTGCFGVVISIVKPDGSTLGSSGTCSTTGFLDSLTLPVAGTYTVLVNPQGTTTGSVTVLLNSFNDVTGAITSGTPITVTTSTPGQNAQYTFTGAASQQASVSLTSSTYTGCFAVVASIIKPDGSTLGSSGTCSTSGSLGPLTLPVAGTYTVLINPQGTTTGSATVTLTLTP